MGNEPSKPENYFSHINGYGNTQEKALDALFASIIFHHGGNFFCLISRESIW